MLSLQSPQIVAALEAWLARAQPRLGQRWSDYLASLPPQEPAPDLDRWLSILRGAIRGRDVSGEWPGLWLNSDSAPDPPPPSPARLAGLLELTYASLLECAPSDPGPALWQALLALQHRLLETLPATPPAAPTLTMDQVDHFDELSQRLSEVATLYSLANQLTGSLDLEELLNAIVVGLRGLLGCRGCCIFLLDETRSILEIKAAAGLKAKWRQAARLRMGEGAAGRAVAERTSVYIPDTLQDPDFIFFDKSVRSLLVVPLQTKQKVIGAINVDDSQPNAFGPAQERLLTIAAAQAVIAIENARLFNEILSEQQLTRAIIQHMADGVLMVDHEGRIARCNPALARMLELRVADIVGQNVHDPGLEPHLAAICAPATRHERTGVLANEVQVAGPPARTLRVYVTAMTDEAGDLMGEVRVVHDVTKERELDQMKDDFVSTVSHELRTPLFSIQGFVRLILDDPKLDEQTRREFLTIIDRQTNNLAEMVTNLLDLSRLAEGRLQMERQPVQILDVIGDVVLELQGYARQQEVQLLSELPSELPRVLGDARRLEQVTVNLLGNAIKFTPRGGKVVIRAGSRANHVLVAVTDTGIGIPEDKLPHLFSRFYRVEEHRTYAVGGSGLGLHISEQIVKGHGGRIWVRSEVGRGSTFTFSLPILPE